MSRDNDHRYNSLEDFDHYTKVVSVMFTGLGKSENRTLILTEEDYQLLISFWKDRWDITFKQAGLDCMLNMKAVRFIQRELVSEETWNKEWFVTDLRPGN